MGRHLGSLSQRYLEGDPVVRFPGFKLIGEPECAVSDGHFIGILRHLLRVGNLGDDVGSGHFEKIITATFSDSIFKCADVVDARKPR